MNIALLLLIVSGMSFCIGFVIGRGVAVRRALKDVHGLVERLRALNAQLDGERNIEITRE